MSFDQPSAPGEQPGATPPEQPTPAAPETTQPPAQPTEPGSQPLTPAGQQLQEQQDAAEKQGYFGSNPDPRPNSDYSLESGPQSPSLLEQQLDAAKADVERLQGELDAERERGNSQEQVS